MRITSIILFLMLSVCAFAQDIPDSLSVTVNQLDDTSFTISTYVLTIDEDGKRSESVLTSEVMDSTDVAFYLMNADTRGLTVGRVKVVGRQRVATLAQQFFMAEKAVGDVFPNAFEKHTGTTLDRLPRGFDNLFVGTWTVFDRMEKVETQIEVERRRNGRLVSQVDGKGARADIPSRNEIVLRNIPGTSGAISLFRIKPGAKVLRSIDSRYVLRPYRAKKDKR